MSTYIIMLRLGSQNNYKVIAFAHELAEIQQKHNDLLRQYDPDMLNISRICPVTVSTDYSGYPDIGVEISWE